MELFENASKPTIFKGNGGTAAVHPGTPTVRTGRAILGIVDVCPMLWRLAQFQIAAENEQLEVGISTQPSWILKQSWI